MILLVINTIIKKKMTIIKKCTFETQKCTLKTYFPEREKVSGHGKGKYKLNCTYLYDRVKKFAR